MPVYERHKRQPRSMQCIEMVVMFSTYRYLYFEKYFFRRGLQLSHSLFNSVQTSSLSIKRHFLLIILNHHLIKFSPNKSFRTLKTCDNPKPFLFGDHIKLESYSPPYMQYSYNRGCVSFNISNREYPFSI